MALARILEGIRVLDLSTLLPGPYCSRLLTDFGAEVIKIERPDLGDRTRNMPPLRDGESTLFHLLHHGKKSITLDLKADEGREAFLGLIRAADVLLESFRPDVMERLGIGDDALRGANPRLIHCALRGYGATGAHRDRAGHDVNYVGLAGLLDQTGRAGEMPALLGAPIADVTGGMWATLGILLALYARSSEGPGRKVETSLLGAAVSCLPVALASLMGNQPLRRGEGPLTGGLVCYQVYRCKGDGFMTLGALEPEFWVAFCEAVGRRDLIDCQYAPAVRGEMAYESLCALFATRTREEWRAFLAGVDCCCEPVHSLEEAVVSPVIRALGVIQDESLRPPVQIRPLGADVEFPPESIGRAPQLGEHTEAILRDLCGYTAAQVQALREKHVI